MPCTTVSRDLKGSDHVTSHRPLFPSQGNEPNISGVRLTREHFLCGTVCSACPVHFLISSPGGAYEVRLGPAALRKKALCRWHCFCGCCPPGQSTLPPGSQVLHHNAAAPRIPRAMPCAHPHPDTVSVGSLCLFLSSCFQEKRDEHGNSRRGSS